MHRQQQMVILGRYLSMRAVVPHTLLLIHQRVCMLPNKACYSPFCLSKPNDQMSLAIMSQHSIFCRVLVTSISTLACLLELLISVAMLSEVLLVSNLSLCFLACTHSNTLFISLGAPFFWLFLEVEILV